MTWNPVSQPPDNDRDVICVKQSGYKTFDYYHNGRFQMSGDYVAWCEPPEFDLSMIEVHE